MSILVDAFSGAKRLWSNKSDKKKNCEGHERARCSLAYKAEVILGNASKDLKMDFLSACQLSQSLRFFTKTVFPCLFFYLNPWPVGTCSGMMIHIIHVY